MLTIFMGKEKIEYDSDSDQEQNPTNIKIPQKGSQTYPSSGATQTLFTKKNIVQKPQKNNQPPQILTYFITDLKPSIS